MLVIKGVATYENTIKSRKMIASFTFSKLSNRPTWSL